MTNCHHPIFDGRLMAGDGSCHHQIGLNRKGDGSSNCHLPLSDGRPMAAVAKKDSAGARI